MLVLVLVGYMLAAERRLDAGARSTARQGEADDEASQPEEEEEGGKEKGAATVGYIVGNAMGLIERATATHSPVPGISAAEA